MKNILIYGDSLTWGRIPGAERFDETIRFTEVCKRELGEGYNFVAEGLSARLAKGDYVSSENRNGFKQFGPILCSHLPLDTLIIFLGTNDLKEELEKTAQQISLDLEEYIGEMKKSCKEMNIHEVSNIIFIAPPHVDESSLARGNSFLGTGAKSEQLGSVIEKMTQRNSVGFFDVSKIVTPSKIDGVHLDAEENIKLGKALAKFLKN